MIVSKLDDQSEAQKAGVQVGDQLICVNDTDVRFLPYQDTLNMVGALTQRAHRPPPRAARG